MAKEGKHLQRLLSAGSVWMSVYRSQRDPQCPALKISFTGLIGRILLLSNLRSLWHSKIDTSFLQLFPFSLISMLLKIWYFFYEECIDTFQMKKWMPSVASSPQYLEIKLKIWDVEKQFREVTKIQGWFFRRRQNEVFSFIWVGDLEFILKIRHVLLCCDRFYHH